MTTATELQTLLRSLDGRSYKAYKEIRGHYQFPQFGLHVDSVQGDPFAAPSRLRVVVPQSVAEFPAEYYATPSRAVALRDYLTREFAAAARSHSEQRGSGKSGLIAIAPTGQQILERSALWIDSQQVEARFVVGLPARGRSILGRQAAELLCEDLPDIVRRSLLYSALDAAAVQQQVQVVEDADWLRNQLAGRSLVAFIPNGAILPRQSGVDDAPLSDGALPFQSPPSLQVTFDRPHQGLISGLGIPVGVTLIVGGGYHGKSTLLRAIALGIYNHRPGDGREQVVTHPAAVKIRAEDGRAIASVNISPFINNLPQGRSTTHFSTPNASGSTSQAASIIEALEVGAQVLLVDEDTSATNFMIRDRRMQALIAKDREPITPFVDKVRQLYTDYGVSTVLVMGGSGDYFDVADTVIAMGDYAPQDVTAQARAIARQLATHRTAEGGSQFGDITPRIPHIPRQPSRRDPAEVRSPKLKVRDVDELVFGDETIDLSAVEQLVEVNQVRAIGAAIAYLQQQYGDRPWALSALLAQLQADLDAAGLDALTPYPQGDLAQFRPAELAAAINRLRTLVIRSLPDPKS
ncbi:MAG: ABC-ATPase domain-containing protein [Kaiparowitsia implicata GSE-PSE-MK54-09C]|jgi:predicted ABC-class ATPase|nr:ABC-ATPase domain-containing protein [Kaiparowitsia implicata GSE-PSE-MK54-09C]